MENCLIISTKTEHNSTSSLPLSRNTYINLPKEMYENVYSSSCHSPPNGKQSKCLSAMGHINNLWYIHIMIQQYIIIKKNELLLYAIEWMNLTNITLNKKRQKQKYNSDFI